MRPRSRLPPGAAPRVVAKIHVGSQPCAGVAAFGSFWQTNYGTATLSRVNPRTNKVTRTGRLGAQPCGIAAGAGSLWIDGYGTSRVERVNRRTLKVVKRIRVGVNVWDVAYAFGSVWASNNFDGSVARINPATNRVVKTIKTGGQPSNFADRRGRALGRLERDVGPGRLPDRPRDEHVDRGAHRARQPERNRRLARTPCGPPTATTR